MVWNIREITHLDGTPRQDLRYPIRRGSVVKFIPEYVGVGIPLVWEYIKDNQGNSKTGTVRTSLVKDIEVTTDEYENILTFIVTTKNSIYHFDRSYFNG